MAVNDALACGLDEVGIVSPMSDTGRPADNKV
jgi:hypothetical protein